MRALELGRPMLRATNTGITSAIAHDGRVDRRAAVVHARRPRSDDRRARRARRRTSASAMAPRWRWPPHSSRWLRGAHAGASEVAAAGRHGPSERRPKDNTPPAEIFRRRGSGVARIRQSRKIKVFASSARTSMQTFQQIDTRALSSTGIGRAARCCSPTTWKSARARRTRQRSCARSVPSRGAPRTCSRRAGPKDGRYGENPNRMQHYYQFQVVLKPSPADILDLLPGVARGARLRSDEERRPLRRGRLGESDARRMGPGLGSVAERHGGDAVHVLPAGRRPRLQSDHRRDHLRPRAPRDVPAGQGQRVRPRVDDVEGRRCRARADLRRRLSPERGRAVDLQLRAIERAEALRAVRASSKARRSGCSKRSCRCPATR